MEGLEEMVTHWSPKTQNSLNKKYMQKQIITLNKNKIEEATTAYEKLLSDIEQEKIDYQKGFDDAVAVWEEEAKNFVPKDGEELRSKPTFQPLPEVAHEILVELDCACGEICGNITFPYQKGIEGALLDRNEHTVTCDKCSGN